MSAPILLPTLRQDLRLRKGPSTGGGAQTWLIYDPVRHRYFSVTSKVYELLSLWTENGAEGLLKWIAESDNPDEKQQLLKNLIFFMQSNNLTDGPPEGDYRAYAKQVEAGEKSNFQQALHGYMFFRLPLFRPQRFLEQTQHLVAPFFSNSFVALLCFMGVIGLYFVSRQWDEFVSTFMHFFSLDGFLIYGASLIFVKTLHELGHAYMAVRQGARVNTMGVAFLVMLPVLYTDVSDSWRLRSKKQKLLIDGAGILVELSIAMVATFLWVFLPEGALKSAAFVLATTSWIMSLAINLNPFMRFDGYYLLADSWGIANLQARSFAFGTWWMREVLFGLKLPPPEPLKKVTQYLLIFYAIGVWLYRFFLFLGLALLVYHMFFKVLGVILFVIEIIWFIVRPILKEIGTWWEMRETISSKRRALITACVASFVVLLSLMPVNTTVRMPALMLAGEEARVFAPFPAYVKDVYAKNGVQVQKGDPLVTLHAPQLEHELAQAERKIALLKARKARHAGDLDELQNLVVLEQELAASEERAAGLRREQERLVVRAPTNGVIRDLNSFVHSGRWVDAKTELALVVSASRIKAKAFVEEEDLWRVKNGSEGLFISDDPQQAAKKVRLEEVSYSGTQSLDIPYLASTYGGPIAVEQDGEKKPRPVDGTYLVMFSADEASLQKATRGVIHVGAEAESFASAIWRQVMRVLIREAGV